MTYIYIYMCMFYNDLSISNVDVPLYVVGLSCILVPAVGYAAQTLSGSCGGRGQRDQSREESPRGALTHWIRPFQ